MDLEMSGLDPDRCAILEIATIITDAELEVIAEGPDLVIHHDDSVLAAMDEWCTKHHGQSGLTAAVQASTISLAEAEARTLEFVAQHTAAKVSPLCGNTIWQDRRFLVKHMPTLDAHLHYRLVDVSTIKELARRWYPHVRAPGKSDAHRAHDDIRESIAELRFYREHVFK
jgi:oligoribonuclease